MPWEEFKVASAIVEEAVDLQTRRTNKIIDTLSRSIGGHTASRIMKGLKGAFKKG